jgi:TPR repeat protein
MLCVTRYFFLMMVCLAATALRGDVYDCSKGAPGISFTQVFGQLADGLDCTEDGEIFAAAGKRLQLTDFTKVAFFRYVASVNPTVTVSQLVRCSTCNGKGGRKGIDRNANDILDIGRIVDERCSSCNGSGGSYQQLRLTVTYTGPFPPWPDSPRLVAFRGKLNSARDGNGSAQLEVAQAYLEGKFVSKSLEDARTWFVKAAIQGRREALGPLALLYMDAGNSFHDYAFGLALSAVADPTSVQAEGGEFVSFKVVANPATDPEAALRRQLQVLEAGLLAPRIALGLGEKALVEKVLSPVEVRQGFPTKGPVAAGVRPDKRTLFIRGVARYFGYGFPGPDRQEGLRLLESAACLKDADAFFLIALHFDLAKDYPASSQTAWAYYNLANRLGEKDPFCMTRLRQLERTDVATDWADAPDALWDCLQQGKFTPKLIRDFIDLSLYRVVLPSVLAGTTPSPYDTATTQEVPLSKGQVLAQVREMLRLKLNLLGVSPDDESIVRKCWDDGSTRYYSVSGIVTFVHPDSRRETAPYTVCFMVTTPATPATLLYCSAGTVHFGQPPPQCGRRP